MLVELERWGGAEVLLLFELVGPIVEQVWVQARGRGRQAGLVKVEVDLGPLVLRYFVLFHSFDRIWNQGLLVTHNFRNMAI